MKIEIWSDVVCPFCYIGKRRFEQALEQFEHKDMIEVEWKSFQLDPDTQPEPGKGIYDYLAERKGISRAQSVMMHNGVTKMAAEAGLDYRFDLAKVANTFNAHRLIQFAKSKGIGNEAEEALFRSYFTDGKDIGDTAALAEIGASIGIDKSEVEKMLESNANWEAVEADIREAQQIGVTGVPFFVLDRKYAVSGAQSPETFLQAMRTAWNEKGS
jgi:predicted DsbA family dithiol-disulfide isomerase